MLKLTQPAKLNKIQEFINYICQHGYRDQNSEKFNCKLENPVVTCEDAPGLPEGSSFQVTFTATQETFRSPAAKNLADQMAWHMGSCFDTSPAPARVLEAYGIIHLRGNTVYTFENNTKVAA